MRSCALVLLCCFLFPFYSGAQQKDFVGLTGFSATYKINRSWDLGAGTQAMFNQNLSELWIGFADVSAGFAITRSIKTELHYRKIQFRTLQNTYEDRNLFYHTISLSESRGRWSFVLRNRLQQLVYGEHFNDRYKGPRWYNRDRFTVKYRLNYYHSFYLAGEIFQPLNHPVRKKIDQYRASAGYLLTLSEALKLELYYQLQQQLHRSSGNNAFFVLGFNVYYKIA